MIDDLFLPRRFVWTTFTSLVLSGIWVPFGFLEVWYRVGIMHSTWISTILDVLSQFISSYFTNNNEFQSGRRNQAVQLLACNAVRNSYHAA